MVWRDPFRTLRQPTTIYDCNWHKQVDLQGVVLNALMSCAYFLHASRTYPCSGRKPPYGCSSRYGNQPGPCSRKPLVQASIRQSTSRTSAPPASRSSRLRNYSRANKLCTHAMRLRPPSGRPVAARGARTRNRRCCNKNSACNVAGQKSAQQPNMTHLVLSDAADLLAGATRSPQVQQNQGPQG